MILFKFETPIQIHYFVLPKEKKSIIFFLIIMDSNGVEKKG